MTSHSRKRTLEDVVTWGVARPLPSSSVLASLSQQQAQRKQDDLQAVGVDSSMNIPLLNAFLKDKSPSTNQGAEGSANSPNDVEETEELPSETVAIPAGDVLERINDPSESTLSQGQHKRYLQLCEPASLSNYRVRNERRKLRQLVTKEQELYLQARLEFLDRHSQRFMTGFASPTISYAHWHSQSVQAYRNEWRLRACPTMYGAVIQEVSLESNTLRSRTTRDRDRFHPNDLFESQVLVHNHSDDKSESISPDNDSSKMNQTVPRMKPPQASPLLRLDPVAMTLAKQHNASLLCTRESLVALLMSSEWSIPLLKTCSSLQVLDSPIPQPLLPRECLSRGMEETLIQEGQPAQEHVFVYTLLIIKTPGSINKQNQKQVIVRSRAGSNIHVHLEYFYKDSGGALETLSPEEESLWILDNLLEPHTTNIQVIRIDVSSWTTIQRTPVSAAHALASDHDAAIAASFGRMVKLLIGLDTLPHNAQEQSYLLQYQPSKTKVSVHPVCGNDKDAAINLETEWERCDAIRTGKEALLACFRPWIWNDPTRAPHTFPVATAPKKR